VPAGTKFSYASVETQVLGLVLRRAVGTPVADYLHDKLWAPMGRKPTRRGSSTARARRRPSAVSTRCCDYARLGLLLAHGGQRRGQQVIPAGWLEDATSVRPDQWHLQPGIATPFFGYGYQTWIFPGQQRRFALLGVRGQAIYVDPSSRLVMVHTAVRKQPVDLAGARELGARWGSLVRDLGR
jgi:CubicO group peptidase (beta-lactamase class C family)